MELTDEAKALLRNVAAGDIHYSRIPKKPWWELKKRGYVRRTGDNGGGRATITPRGILKALQLNLIPKHPRERLSMTKTHARFQEKKALEARWGPGRA